MLYTVSMSTIKYDGPVVLVIMDGFGYSPNREGNAILQGNTPVLDELMRTRPMRIIKAAGNAVGLAEGDQGNSEVGHYTMGSGQIIDQGAVLVNNAIESGEAFEGQTWKGLIENVNNNGSTLHLLGGLSDGNVHFHINHLLRLLDRAQSDGVRRVRVHTLLDGRDTPPDSSLGYVDMLEEKLGEVRNEGFDYRIASGGGREHITMDRYGSNWGMIERGWQTHVLGEARQFGSAREAIETLRAEDPAVTDQFLSQFVIADDGHPIGTINDGDSMIFYNFRQDRAIQFSEAMMAGDDFARFDRKRVPKIYFAGMVKYDEDRNIPEHTLVAPVEVKNTLGEMQVNHGVRRFVISESIKFGHVTFYFNGNKVGRFSEELEEYVDIPNKVGEPDTFPWMKSDELTDILVDRIKSGRFDYCMVNYPNGDIIGHIAKMPPSIVAVEAVDIAVGRILKAVDEAGGVALITADHGNIEEELYLDENGEPVRKNGELGPKTSHTTNPVPFIVYDNTENRDKYELKEGEFGLANIASTVAILNGLESSDRWNEAMIKLKD
jgi:2,3-bisphosphoglycerate-independent phosphoglycerate mutase